jgi:hypothetical protein
MATLQRFIVLFTATSGSTAGGFLAWKSRGVMTLLTQLRDGQTTGNETLAKIHTQLKTLVERVAPPPKAEQ